MPPERGFETSASGALPLADALAVLWGDDQRPLLVLRECRHCVGTDVSLLHRAANNEATRLLTNWFRVVRLPTHVIERHHAFFDVFGGQGFGDSWPHFFLLAHPGAKPVAFTGTHAPSRLVKAMYSILRQRYLSDPRQAVKRWQRLLGQFDMVEAGQKRLRRELREARAEIGPTSSRALRLQQQLEVADAEMKQLLAREKRVRNLVLRPFPAKVAVKSAKESSRKRVAAK